MIIELSPNILENLSKTELEIVNFINDNEERLSELSIVDIAFETYSSHPQYQGPSENVESMESMNCAIN